MKIRVYEAIADAFVAEGVDAFFVLIGDGNMHMTSALHAREIRCLHMRHEHSACSAAMSYATARGDVGVASVTHGIYQDHDRARRGRARKNSAGRLCRGDADRRRGPISRSFRRRRLAFPISPYTGQGEMVAAADTSA